MALLVKFIYSHEECLNFQTVDKLAILGQRRVAKTFSGQFKGYTLKSSYHSNAKYCDYSSHIKENIHNIPKKIPSHTINQFDNLQ